MEEAVILFAGDLKPPVYVLAIVLDECPCQSHASVAGCAALRCVA